MSLALSSKGDYYSIRDSLSHVQSDITQATYHKEGVSHDIIRHISFHQEVVYAMSSQCPVEGVMDGTVPDIRTIHCSTQMEVDSISPQSKCLSHVTYFCVLDPE